MSKEPDVASYLGIPVPDRPYNVEIVKRLNTIQTLISDAKGCDDLFELKDIVADMDWYESAIGDAIELIENNIGQAMDSFDSAMIEVSARLTEEEETDLEQSRIVYRLKHTKK